jgi:medium-chain acyl-[acyl-carrier-protein] hydrolase
MHGAKQRFINFRPNPLVGLRLFCFPYAGGGSSIFRTWAASLPSYVEVYAANLPGRGARIAEPPFTHISTMVESIADDLRPHLGKPFAFFGHSMGAIIGFELARLLRREDSPGPLHLFVSGHPAPQLPVDFRRTYDLPEQELIEELRRLNGTPRRCSRNPS